METYRDQVTFANQPLVATVANKLALALFTFAKLSLAARLCQGDLLSVLSRLSGLTYLRAVAQGRSFVLIFANTR